MLLTALECRTQGLTFASVHDSYWTHPSTIDQMSTVIRGTFIALHSSDVLGRLLSEFRERYAGYKVPVGSLRNSHVLKQLGILDTAAGLVPRCTTNTDPVSETVGVTATVTTGEEAAAEDDYNELKDEEGVLDRASPRAVSVSKEQAMQLLKSSHHEQAAVTPKQTNSNSKAESKSKGATAADDSMLEGKFVDLVDLLLPVPSKGEFDVNKIKSSLYFFS